MHRVYDPQLELVETVNRFHLLKLS